MQYPSTVYVWLAALYEIATFGPYYKCKLVLQYYMPNRF